MGGGAVSGVHSIASGSTLHISVSKHINIVEEGLYPASHMRVAVDPGNLLVNVLKAPLVGLVNTGQTPERVSVIILNSITDSTLTNGKVVLSSRTVPSTVGGHSADSVAHIVLSSHSDRGGCEDSSRELGRR